MQINQGLFAQNGRCGYLLQPECMRQESYNPYDKKCLKDVEPITVSLTVSVMFKTFMLYSKVLLDRFE